MKIVGAEGLDAQTIRDEVARGARFVVYHYCISIVVLTFKRPSNVYYLRPGRNRMVKGLPFVLISLLLGWWGFPWGPIYTLQSVVNDLLGGKDMTDAILASLTPAPAAGPVPAATPPPVPPAASTTFGSARDVPPSPAKKIAVGVAVVVLLAAAVIGSVCIYRGTHLTVALTSGLAKPYSVQLNGTTHELLPGQPVILTLAEGRFVLAGVPHATAPLYLEFSLPFFSHLFESRIAVINPDRAAILYLETIAYHPTGSAPHPEERPTYVVYAGEASYFLPEPDYLFSPFPQQIKMSSEASREKRTRLAQLSEGSLEQRVGVLQEKCGAAVMRHYLEILAAQGPDDDDLLTVAATKLAPADGRAFFERHLTDRPVRVEWHRYYQQYMQLHFPDHDLAKQYRAYLAAEPEDGAWSYLVGRLSDDPAEMRRLDERALAAPRPCYYAYNGLGFDALARADFTRAVAYFATAEEHGLQSESVRQNRRLALLGARDYRQLCADAVAARQADPGSLPAAGEEITCDLLAGLGRPAAEHVKVEYLARIDRTAHPGPRERAVIDAYLSAAIDYGAGDAAAFARDMDALDNPECAFEAAVSRGDPAGAAEALHRISDPAPTAFLVCALAAEQKHEDAAAESCFNRALELMDRDKGHLQRLAAVLRRPAGPEVEEISALLPAPESQRIVLAVLGWRHPDRRAYYFDWAKRMNIEPSFPRLLIDQALASPAPGGT